MPDLHVSRSEISPYDSRLIWHPFRDAGPGRQGGPGGHSWKRGNDHRLPSAKPSGLKMKWQPMCVFFCKLGGIQSGRGLPQGTKPSFILEGFQMVAGGRSEAAERTTTGWHGG